MGPCNIVCGPVSILRAVIERTRGDCSCAIVALNAGRICVSQAARRIMSGYRGQPTGRFVRHILAISRYIATLRRIISGASNHVILAIDPVQCGGCNCRRDRLSGTALLLTTSCIRQTGERRIRCFPTCRLIMSRLQSCQFCTPSVLRPSPRAISCLFSHFTSACFSTTARSLLRR